MCKSVLFVWLLVGSCTFSRRSTCALRFPMKTLEYGHALNTSRNQSNLKPDSNQKIGSKTKLVVTLKQTAPTKFECKQSRQSRWRFRAQRQWIWIGASYASGGNTRFRIHNNLGVNFDRHVDTCGHPGSPAWIQSLSHLAPSMPGPVRLLAMESCCIYKFVGRRKHANLYARGAPNMSPSAGLLKIFRSSCERGKPPTPATIRFTAGRGGYPTFGTLSKWRIIPLLFSAVFQRRLPYE